MFWTMLISVVIGGIVGATAAATWQLWLLPIAEFLYMSWYEARMRGQILPNWIVVVLVIALFGGIGIILAWRG